MPEKLVEQEELPVELEEPKRRRFPSWLSIKKTPLIPQEIARPKTGWKFHIAIDADGENPAKTWNAVYPILIEHGVKSCKVVNPAHVEETGLGDLSRRFITIYAHNNPGFGAADWQDILQENY